MDPMVGQKLIELSQNVNLLNAQVANLTAQVAALMDVASAQARHFARAQGMQQPQMGVPQMGQMQGGNTGIVPPMPQGGQGFDGS